MQHMAAVRVAAVFCAWSVFSGALLVVEAGTSQRRLAVVYFGKLGVIDKANGHWSRSRNRDGQTEVLRMSVPNHEARLYRPNEAANWEVAVFAHSWEGGENSRDQS